MTVRKPATRIVGNGEIRYAVVNYVHQEVMTANHRTIGEAYNSMLEDYNSPRNMAVVATRNDKILGEAARNGTIKYQPKHKFPDTIWGGGKHPYFDPAIAKKVTETGREKLSELITEQVKEHSTVFTALLKWIGHGQNNPV
jgi:hypothetical protein